MGRQYLRNRPRSNPKDPTTARIEGWPVKVAGDAVSTWSDVADRPQSGVAELGEPVDIGELRRTLGDAGIRRAAKDAGRKPPSARTIRRWVKQDRIPHALVEELAQRRGLVKRRGGIDAVAEQMGVSKTTVSNYQTGRTKSLRPTSQRGLEEVRTTDTLARAEVTDITDARGRKIRIADERGKLIRQPVITVTAAYEYRHGGKTSADYRTSRTFDIHLQPPDNEDFAAAEARGDHAASIAIIEKHLTLDYATTFEDFDDESGFHMQEVLDFQVDWQ
ncbi:hypothetical protein [Nocardia wallacei]|uniref:hypothetical protein n=1 Tax=Nocardia wallacei TaxID=480035 RepID=UPI002455C604|nr:hypothetical protein [Nocardia wallacei]